MNHTNIAKMKLNRNKKTNRKLSMKISNDLVYGDLAVLNRKNIDYIKSCESNSSGRYMKRYDVVAVLKCSGEKVQLFEDKTKDRVREIIREYAVGGLKMERV